MAKEALWVKDPNARLDYVFRFEDWMVEGDSIQAANITITPSGLVLEQTVPDTDKVSVWLSGGVSGVRYRITCEITTLDNRIEDKTKTLLCRPT